MSMHNVTIDNDDDGYPIKRGCYCPFGRDHFADEPIEPAAKGNASADLTVPRYRDDVTICLYTRFGREHERHIYSFIYPEANGTGWYECGGLGADEAGHPYPKRPGVRTGLLEEDLVDDLVDWWHAYGTSGLWEAGDLVLPLALDAAARHFVTHAQRLIEQQLKERWKDRVEQITGEPEKAPSELQPPVGKEFYRYPNGRLARMWPLLSDQPNVPEGFVVGVLVNDRPHPPYFTYALDGPPDRPKFWAWFQSTEQGDYDPTDWHTWQELNGSSVEGGVTVGATALVEVLSGRARRWHRGEPEPDMPQGFEVARHVGSGFHRYVRLDLPDRDEGWVAMQGGDWCTWEGIWYGPGSDEVVEVMPGDPR